MAFVPWPEIDLFHNVRRAFATVPDLGAARIPYRAKVKLHGTNAAVQVLPDGTVETQSRSAVITPANDNAGFAAWGQAHRESWARSIPRGTIVYGEWAGPGIQKGVAVSRIPEKIFAVFAAMPVGGNDLTTDPDALFALVPSVAHVLPWYGESVTVDWMESPEALEPVTRRINAMVEAVEACDPWVRERFGVEGTGEGLVFYPQGLTRREDIVLRLFKAKGEEHRVLKSKAAAQIDPEVVRGIEQFVEMVCTEARLEQGASATTPDGAAFRFETKRIGAFLDWVANDVAKETRNELAASGLDEGKVRRAVIERARKWYLAKVASS